MEKDLLLVRKDGEYYGHVTVSEDNTLITHGVLGEGNIYSDLVDLFKNGLSGHGISMDEDIFWRTDENKGIQDKEE